VMTMTLPVMTMTPPVTTLYRLVAK